MKFKRLLVFLLIILSISELQAQQQNPYERPGICLIYTKTQKQKIIYINTKIKYWLYSSNKEKKGRITGIKDSSIIIKAKEIQIKDIRKIGSSDLTTKWKFVKSINPSINYSEVKRFEKIEEIKESWQKDTANVLSFSLNSLNCLFDQYTLEIEYQLNKKYSLGFGGGIIKANCWWNQNQALYNGTDDYNPFGYYNGWLMMMNFKRLNINKCHWYLETSLFYKYLYYDKLHFTNSFGDQNPDVEWIRSEIASEYGIKFLIGKRIYLSNHFALETIFGISFKGRFRSYITYWYNQGYEVQGYDTSWGIVHQNQFFPGIQAGLLLTFGNFRIK
ncbi:MAG: hypothetical protein ABR968_14420 [Bacteroidales bacterium]|jgi:hypothetical protein